MQMIKDHFLSLPFNLTKQRETHIRQIPSTANETINPTLINEDYKHITATESRQQQSLHGSYKRDEGTIHTAFGKTNGRALAV